MKLLLSLLWSGFLSLIGLEKKDPEVERLQDDLTEAKHEEQVFTAPDRDKRRVIDAFKLHNRDD